MYLSLNSALIILFFAFFLSVTTFSCYVLIQRYFISGSNNSNLEFIGIIFLAPTTLVTILHLIGLVHVWVYFLIIILITLLSLGRWKSFYIKIKKFTKSDIIITLMIFSVSIFVYYSDAYTNISLNHPDTLMNYYWTQTLLVSKELVYQPGLPGLIYPLLYFFEIKYILNYLGATLGIISYSIILLMLSSILSRKEMIVFISLSLSFLFNILTTVRFGLHSGVIFQVLIFSYLIFLIKILDDKTYRANFRSNAFVFFLIFFQAGIFSATQTLTLLILGLFILLAVGIQIKKSFYYSLLYFISSFFGFLSSTLLVGLKELKNSLQYIALYLPSNSSVLNLSSNSSVLNLSSNSMPTNELATNFNLLTVIIDFVLPTNQIRPLLESYYAIGTYLLIIPLLLISVHTFKKQDFKLLIFSLSCLFYIVVLNTGIFELTLAKGRSGWNLLILFPVTLVLLIRNALHNLPITLFRFSIFIIFLTSLFNPPRANRPYPEDAFIFAKQISEYEINYVYTNIPNLEVASKNLIIVEDLAKIISLETNNIAILLNPSASLVGVKDNISITRDQRNKFIALINYLKQNNFIIVRETSEFTVLKSRQV